MKKVFFGIVLGLLFLRIVTLGALYFYSGHDAIISSTHKVQVATSTIMASTSAYLIDVEYPQFGMPTIDTQIKKDIDDAVQETKDTPANPADSATQQNSLYARFENVYQDADIVSVKLILSTYSGGAHPMTLFSGVNFDKKTGKRLGLSDVLPLIGKSVEDISKESIKEFSAKFGDTFFKEGATTNPENYSSFLINKDTVTFIFQQYQVASYADGPQEVVFRRVK